VPETHSPDAGSLAAVPSDASTVTPPAVTAHGSEDASGRRLRDLIAECAVGERIGLLHHVIAVADRDRVRGLAIASDGERLAALDEQGAAVVYDVRTWQVVRRVAFDAPVLRLALAPDHPSLLAILTNRHAVLTALGARAFAWHDVAGGALIGAYSPDGAMLALGCADGSAWLYSLRDDRWRFVQEHAAYIRSMVFSPDSQRLLSADDLQTGIAIDVAKLFATPPAIPIASPPLR
jgi:WD40 repeat protein